METEYVLQMIDLYLQEHFNIISNPDFEEILMADLRRLCGIEDELDEEDVDDGVLHECLYYYYLHIMPRREFSTTFTYGSMSVEETSRKMEYLMGKPQPVQKTPEWYEYRRSVITASNLYKVFGSQSVKNELIYEKCKVHVAPVGMVDGDAASYVNTNSSLHWGNKYEPLSVLMYEHIYSTTIRSLGCITHDTIPFIGASPDGINANPLSPRYGRLVEIKNVKSREIDGTISEPYWIQMQIQMEVCDINECDFLETKFVEYDGYADYMKDECELDEEMDGDDYEYEYTKYTRKVINGMMMYFHKPPEPPTYVYKPLSILPGEGEDEWETNTTNEYVADGYQWITNIYWKLVVFNCQLVLRNKFWFSKSLPQIEEVWNTILEERIDGFDHRKPKQSSRSKKMVQSLY
jgi:putative phage-type endonuclease